MSPCEPFVPDDLVFPRQPANRPGLPRIGYRIGAYPDVVEALLRGIDRSAELAAWTHRAPDDPGVALLEGAALVADVLTFYQERYANEAYLRTATWRESVAKLVRLVGYRPAPGVGGRATFALQVKGEGPVEVPAGLPVKAELEAREDPADFLTAEAVTAWPHLSRFHLYRHRSYAATIPAGTDAIEVASPGGAALEAVGLRAGDRLVLVAPEPGWTSSGSSFTADQRRAQVVEVEAVATTLGRTVLTLKAPLVASWPAPVAAYRLGRSFRHFGHNAPVRHTTNVVSGGVVTGAAEHVTDFERHIDASHVCTIPDLEGGVAGEAVPLDRQVDDLSVGALVVIQARVRNPAGGVTRELTAVRTVRAAPATSLSFASLAGASTVLELDAPLNRNPSLADLRADVRDIRVSEVTSPALALRPTPQFASGIFSSGLEALSFFGTLEEVRALAGRRLLLEKVGEAPLELTVTDQTDDFALPAGVEASARRMWRVSFDRPPAPLTRADFDEAAPAVTVWGNLVDAAQGKEEGEVTLGNGDARAAFQTFPLPAEPLTWLPAPGATPPRSAELEVRVQGRRWARVDSFLGRGPEEHVYVVRESPEGGSWVQFGDGETGARLPSGVKNVTARYRTGVGARGSVKPGTDPSAGRRVERLEKVRLPGVVSDGADPEGPEVTRHAAPGRIQGLGRLVSLRDFETEALSVGGVVSAAAAWTLHDGVPALVLRVLLQAGREAEFDDLRSTLQAYGRCRGADRFPVVIEQTTLRYLFLDLRCAFDPAAPRADVEAAVRAALGVGEDRPGAAAGLFGLGARRPGGPEHALRVEAVAKAVEGVVWCRATGFGMFAAGASDPEALTPPPAPRTAARRLVPAATEVLRLHPSHLTLVSAPPPPGGECDA